MGSKKSEDSRLGFRLGFEDRRLLDSAARACGFRSAHLFARDRTIAAARALGETADLPVTSLETRRHVASVLESNVNQVGDVKDELQEVGRDVRRLILQLRESGAQSSPDYPAILAECQRAAAVVTRAGNRALPLVCKLEEAIGG